MNTEVPQNGEKSHRRQLRMLISWHGSVYRKISDGSQAPFFPSQAPVISVALALWLPSSYHDTHVLRRLAIYFLCRKQEPVEAQGIFFRSWWFKYVTKPTGELSQPRQEKEHLF